MYKYEMHCEFRNQSEVRSEFALEQLSKCEQKLTEADYDGAITNSRSFLEAVIADIYQQITDQELPKTGDLMKDYQKVKDLLYLSEEKHSDNTIKSLVRSFISIVSGLDTLSNRMGDRHRRVAKPEFHHGILAVHSAKIIADFLYDTLEFQKKQKDEILCELEQLLESNKRYLSKEELERDPVIKKFTDRKLYFTKRMIKDEVVGRKGIDSFKSSDKYFAMLYICFETLTTDDIQFLFEKFSCNRQAVGLPYFLKYVSENKPYLIQGKEIPDFVKRRLDLDEEGITNK
ncbi:MAG: abortive infection family protein [bacterium]|nr:abortive infection family protein [bacterium]